MGWLKSAHTFSFGDFYDPAQMGFRALRVINDDRVAPAGGFPTHGHRDMEIISYVVDGALEHKDSMGNGSVIRPGDVQRMSAGKGVQHSEFNPDQGAPVRFLQIWILPEKPGIPPSWEQTHFPAAERTGALRVVVSPDARKRSLKVHQDVTLMASVLPAGGSVTHALATGRHAWVQVVKGTLSVNGTALSEGDGAAISGETGVALTAEKDAELLLFDLA